MSYHQLKEDRYSLVIEDTVDEITNRCDAGSTSESKREYTTSSRATSATGSMSTSSKVLRRVQPVRCFQDSRPVYFVLFAEEI